MTTRMALLGAATLVMLAGCNPGTVEPALTLSPSFGEAVHHNMAAQIINPEPTYARAQEGNGRRAADAYVRYEQGRVVRPAPPILGGERFRQPPPQLMQQQQPAPAFGAPQ
jgi:hypothetical protein